MPNEVPDPEIVIDGTPISETSAIVGPFRSLPQIKKRTIKQLESSVDQVTQVLSRHQNAMIHQDSVVLMNALNKVPTIEELKSIFESMQMSEALTNMFAVYGLSENLRIPFFRGVALRALENFYLRHRDTGWLKEIEFRMLSGDSSGFLPFVIVKNWTNPGYTVALRDKFEQNDDPMRGKVPAQSDTVPNYDTLPKWFTMNNSELTFYRCVRPSGQKYMLDSKGVHYISWDWENIDIMSLLDAPKSSTRQEDNSIYALNRITYSAQDSAVFDRKQQFRLLTLSTDRTHRVPWFDEVELFTGADGNTYVLGKRHHPEVGKSSDVICDPLKWWPL